MPKNPDHDCGLCNGTGTMTDGIVAAFSKHYTPNQRCLCTVTDEEIFETLPLLIKNIES